MATTVAIDSRYYLKSITVDLDAQTVRFAFRAGHNHYIDQMKINFAGFIARYVHDEGCLWSAEDKTLTFPVLHSPSITRQEYARQMFKRKMETFIYDLQTESVIFSEDRKKLHHELDINPVEKRKFF